MVRTRLLVALIVVLIAAAIATFVPIAAAAPAAARPIGSQPLDDVLAAATAANRPDCGLTRDRLAALMLSVIFHETGATGLVPPSPMTLSRFDVNAGLFAFNDPNTPFRRAYFSPGVGMWQFDSAGLGQPHAASYFMNTTTAAPAAAAAIVSRWCAAWANPTYSTDQLRRAYTWQPWNACKAPLGQTTGNCEIVHNEILDASGTLVNLQLFAGVSRTGGMQARRCQDRLTGVVVDCYWVNPALAEGYGAGGVAWANPNSGATAPLTAPFYVYELNGSEYRHWINADTGYGGDISASRPLNRNARGNLTWRTGSGVCDVTAGRGSCAVEPPLGPARPVTASHPSIVGQGRGVGLTTYNGQTAVAERRSDGTTKVTFYAPPFWSDPIQLGGLSYGDPDAASWGSDHLEVFVRGGDGAIWRNVLAGGTTSGWLSLGGQFASGPTAVSWGPDRIDVFARGLDGALWASYISGTFFSGWYSLGGTIIAEPDVASWGVNRLDIFATGVDRQLWHRAWNGSSFEPWEPLGGTLTAAPSASSSAPNRIDIAVRGTNGATYVRQWIGTGYTPFASLGGFSAGAPELSPSAPDIALLVVRGADGNLYGCQRAPNGSWFPFVRIP